MKSTASLIFVARALLLVCLSLAPLACAATTSFSDFDRRARAGERLTVVFFGASLTWSANASDPAFTSYRARVAEKLEQEYPAAHFKFIDAAIGGTGSQLGVFRLDRDVLKRKPDLVFLDFTANDDIYSADPETNASYESLVRRIIRDGQCPVVQVLFPFAWNIKSGDLGGMKRRDTHQEISKHYNTGVGDAVALCLDRVKSGQSTIEALWPYDGVHPGDAGYAVFADAAWDGFKTALREQRTCTVPEKMLHADTYMTFARVRLSSLGKPPAVWRVTHPNLTAAYHDMLMSRWLDDEVVAAGGEKSAPAARLTFRVKAKMLLLFGEATVESCQYRIYVDGEPLQHKTGKDQTSDLFSARSMATSSMHHVNVATTELDPAVEHTVEIEPIFEAGKRQELRLESVCVAGGDARVLPAKE